MHKTNRDTSKHPLVQALAAEYARHIKSLKLKENQETQIAQLYLEFRHKYECLKKMIEAQEGDSIDSFAGSSAAPSRGLSRKSTD